MPELSRRPAGAGMTEPWTPLCMDADELADWAAANEVLRDGRAARPCLDCPPSWAETMAAAGSCHGTPGGGLESLTLRDGSRLTLPRRE